MLEKINKIRRKQMRSTIEARDIGTFLQGLKDTGADPGELAHLRWIDVNIQSRTITINHPVKGHNTRILTVSTDFIHRLQALPKRGEKIFSYESIRSTFYHSRKRIASKLANPRILKISFTTFRHWKATTEYHKKKDILYVMKLLDHKSIKSTMKYINLEKVIFGELGKDEFTVRIAQNVKEACDLVEVGFEYVTGDYSDGGKIFRKRK